MTVFDEHAKEYDRWFDENERAYQAELDAVRMCMPSTGFGVEVGAGTGRFAIPLDVQIGVEPARGMAQLARRRGLTVCQAVGEQLPFHDGQFDMVLLVTVICFVDDVPTLFRELSRVLKTSGRLVVGFINRDSKLGQQYESRKEANAFYQDARFYAVEEVAGWVKEAGFDAIQFCQTLFGGPSEFSMRGLKVRKGCSDGAFVVLSAQKRT